MKHAAGAQSAQTQPHRGLTLVRLVTEHGTSCVSAQRWDGHAWIDFPVDAAFAHAFAADADVDVDVDVDAVGTQASGESTTPEAPSSVSEAVLDDHAFGAGIALLLPGSWVWSAVESVPRPVRKQSAALGYLVEDRLAEDVEDLHFVCQPLKGDLCTVYAIAEEKIRALYDQLQRLNWPIVAVLPEYQLLSAAAEGTTVWLDGQSAHLWYEEGYGLTSRREHVSALLTLAEDQQEEGDEGSQKPSAQISVLGAQESDQLLIGELESVFGERLSVRADAETLLADRAKPGNLVNLLSGAFRLKEVASEKDWWRLPVKVAAFCFVAQLVFFLAAGGFFSWQANQAAREAETTFKEIFPNDRAGADLRRQIQGYLNQAGSGGSNFSGQVQELSRAWVAHKGASLRLQSLRFDGNRGEMVIQVKAANLSDLDAFVSGLGNGPFNAELLAANELEKGVSGRVRMR